MPTSVWRQLTAGTSWFRGAGRYPIAAYSEFVPAPRPSCKPYNLADAPTRDGASGWKISAYEEGFQIRPGLEHIAARMVESLVRLASGKSGHGISANKLTDNPCWPKELAEQASRLSHERYILLAPLALSRTLDDKGRVRWTLFGGSEQGPARAFWKSFPTGSTTDKNAALAFLRRLLGTAYGLESHQLVDLSRAGFRILPDDKPLMSFWKESPLPTWTKPFIWRPGQPLRGVQYLLTFRPFANLPESVQKAYLAGTLHLLPCPGSLLFWGVKDYLRLAQDLPCAAQIPLLHLVPRTESWPRGLRVPQSGWLHEPKPGLAEPPGHFGPFRNTYKRSHRWEKVHRYEDELAVGTQEDRLAHVLFSTDADHIGLYGKPMARNVQLWKVRGEDLELLLDGPRATPKELAKASLALKEGGAFGYRFQFPAMRVGPYELYLHRPAIAFLSPATHKPVILADGPLGYLTAYRADHPDLSKPLELQPIVDDDRFRWAAITLGEDPKPQFHRFETGFNLYKLEQTFQLRGRRPLPRSFARQLLTAGSKTTLDEWLAELPLRFNDREAEATICTGIHTFLSPDDPAKPTRPLPSSTYEQTARRSFEIKYWKTIAYLATGRFVNKDNADCVRDENTQAWLREHDQHDHRDLEALGDYLIRYYRRLIAAKNMGPRAFAGEIPFKWQTDFDFPWMGGWLNNQLGKTYERDVIMVIPGKDHSRAVIMADHYDTAYMLDRYDKNYGGVGARLAAAGADDNHSATAALMLGAPIFLDLSKAGRLDCDIWLIHLTGEEFPSDCLGARALTQRLVEGTLAAHLGSGKKRDLSKTRVQGLYVLDMVAHNNDRAQDIFQIAPGTGAQSMWLAYQAHMANVTWNANTAFWNQRPTRLGKARGRRSSYPDVVPDVAAHPVLSGEVRPPYTPRSTLYNTDGQIFSDSGVPAVLFMENYDINRTGYHDTHDTMENIDLDYGSAVAAITIESVARAATEKVDV